SGPSVAGSAKTAALIVFSILDEGRSRSTRALCDPLAERLRLFELLSEISKEVLERIAKLRRDRQALFVALLVEAATVIPIQHAERIDTARSKASGNLFSSKLQFLLCILLS